MKIKILLVFCLFFFIFVPSVFAISTSFLNNAQKWYNEECKKRPDRIRGENAVLCYSFDKLKELQQNNESQDQKILELEQRIEDLEELHPSLTPTPVPAKKVFITSTQYNGDLGGLAGADAKCQASADGASLGGNWKAWISDSNSTASNRLTHSTGPYELITGTRIADDWTDLTDGNLQTSINKNEFSGTPNYGSGVWTSTNSDGSLSTPVSNITGCNNYASADHNYSWVGHNTSSVVSEWTKWSTDRCDQIHPLYCFEQ